MRENAAADTVIGKLSVEDEDKGQTHFYSIISGNDGDVFMITAEAQLVKSTADKLDVTKTYRLTVEATDSGTPALKVLVLCINLFYTVSKSWL